MPATIETIYDVPLMTTLARHRALTQRTIALQFARRLNKDPSHVLACLRRLEARKLVSGWSLAKAQGNRSQKAVSLTDAGRAWLAPLPIDLGKDPRAYQPAERDYLLQRAFVRLAHEHDGGTCLAATDVFGALHRRAFAVVRRGHDRDAKQNTLPLLERMAPIELELEGLVDSQGRVTLLLPVHQGRSYRRMLELLVGAREPDGTIKPDPTRRSALGILNGVEPLTILLVAAYEHEGDAAAKTVKQWAGKHKLAGPAARVYPFRAIRPVFLKPPARRRLWPG